MTEQKDGLKRQQEPSVLQFLQLNSNLEYPKLAPPALRANLFIRGLKKSSLSSQSVV